MGNRNYRKGAESVRVEIGRDMENRKKIASKKLKLLEEIKRVEKEVACHLVSIAKAADKIKQKSDSIIDNNHEKMQTEYEGEKDFILWFTTKGKNI
jgi:septal ring factor EnvC (AmiA/AmiB activator)